MRRIAVAGIVIGVGIVVVRERMPRLYERLMAHCEGMFDRMPDTFPPMRMLRGIEELQAATAHIERLLETRAAGAAAEAVQDAA
jgi:hypothetical protein